MRGVKSPPQLSADALESGAKRVKCNDITEYEDRKLWQDVPTDIVKLILLMLDANECWRIATRLNKRFSEWVKTKVDYMRLRVKLKPISMYRNRGPLYLNGKAVRYKGEHGSIMFGIENDISKELYDAYKYNKIDLYENEGLEFSRRSIDRRTFWTSILNNLVPWMWAERTAKLRYIKLYL